jgi:hypothetical protein
MVLFWNAAVEVVEAEARLCWLAASRELFGWGKEIDGNTIPSSSLSESLSAVIPIAASRFHNCAGSAMSSGVKRFFVLQ